MVICDSFCVEYPIQPHLSDKRDAYWFGSECRDEFDGCGQMGCHCYTDVSLRLEANQARFTHDQFYGVLAFNSLISNCWEKYFQVRKSK